MVTVCVLLLLLSACSPPVYSRFTKTHLVTEYKTYTEAQKTCRESYTDLHTVHSEEENTQLMNTLRHYEGWIGLQRGPLSGKWSNGDAVTFWNLAVGYQPESCAAMKPDGLWESLQCDMTVYFMCYEQDSLHVSEKALTWQKALDYCHEGNRTGMLTVDSQAEQEELESELRTRGVPPGSLWVELGPNRLSELKVSSRPLTCEDLERQTGAQATPDYVADWTELRAVCKLKGVP